MNEGDGPAAPPDERDPLALARDWITLWQSELAALATDREAQEAWQTLLSLWAGAAGTMLAAAPRGFPNGRGERTDGSARSAAPPRPAPAAAAPDPRDAEIERLHRRIGALEQRLADMERGERPPGGGNRQRVRGPAGRGKQR
jgi:hypothetical protein